MGSVGEVLLGAGGLVQGVGRGDEGLDRGGAGQVHQEGEVGGGVHGGADQLRVVQVEAAYVEGDAVAAERTGDDPPAALAQQGQPLAHQLSGDHVERDVDAVGRGGGVWPEFEPVTPALAGTPVSLGTGGADAYLAFLDEELKPALAEAFPLDPDDATLTGQSFGGLFVVHALLTRPTAFRRYLAGSPSLWWHDRETLDLARKAVADLPAPRAQLYLCIGELENKARFGRQFGPMLPESVRALLPSAMSESDMQGDFFLLEQILREWEGEEFSVEAHMFPQESHESITGAMLSRGLRRLHGYL